jgi:hypothetical protein
VRRAVATVIAAVSGWGQAFAQIPTSSSDVIPRRDAAAFTEGAVELRRLAVCVYRLNPTYVHGMLRSMPGSKIEGRMTRPIGKVMEKCMSEYRPAIRYAAPTLRGALAEAVYLSRYSAGKVIAVRQTTSALPADWSTDEARPEQMAELASHEFGGCVLAADPASVDALLRTEPRSPEENRVIGQLRPRLGGCLYTGQIYKFDAAALRSYLAQAAYNHDRSSLAATAQQTSGNR